MISVSCYCILFFYFFSFSSSSVFPHQYAKNLGAKKLPTLSGKSTKIHNNIPENTAIEISFPLFTHYFKAVEPRARVKQKLGHALPYYNIPYLTILLSYSRLVGDFIVFPLIFSLIQFTNNKFFVFFTLEFEEFLEIFLKIFPPIQQLMMMGLNF